MVFLTQKYVHVVAIIFWGNVRRFHKHSNKYTFVVASYATHLANAASLKFGEAAFDAVEMPGFEPGSEKYLISRFAQDEKIFDTTEQGISSRLIPMDTH